MESKICLNYEQLDEANEATSDVDITIFKLSAIMNAVYTKTGSAVPSRGRGSFGALVPGAKTYGATFSQT